MKIKPNTFKAALRNKEKQIGCWVSLASPYAAEIVASAGFDWLVVDMEHTPGTESQVLGQLQAIAPHGTCLVRPPWNDFVTVKRLLDMGAPGLLFPMVQTVEEAEAAVASTRYPPNGIRGFGGTSRATQFGRIKDYADTVEDETTIILQLETKEAMEIGVEIGTVDGVDGVFFGPADIAASLGYLGQPLHPAVWEAIMPVAKKLMDAGVPVGTLVMDLNLAKQLLDDGFTFVACGMDIGVLARGVDAILSEMKD